MYYSPEDDKERKVWEMGSDEAISFQDSWQLHLNDECLKLAEQFKKIKTIG